MWSISYVVHIICGPYYMRSILYVVHIICGPYYMWSISYGPWLMLYILPKIIFEFRFELSTRFIKRTKTNFLVHWWCVYYNQPTSTPLNQRFWDFVRSSCPVNPDGVRWWHWLWSACSISSFHLVHLSGKRRSELALTWYYNTTSAEKGWFVNSQWEFKIFWSSDWMMKIQIQMLKNRICPGNKPRLFWVTFKLMIFQNFENFHFFSKILRIL